MTETSVDSLINRIVTKVIANSPGILPGNMPEAAVLIPVTNEDVPQIILTRRSRRMKTHSGQVAFPGGMKDEVDINLETTALRESEEEVGIESRSVEVIGGLNQVLSKHRIKVTPFVGLVNPDVKLVPCPSELDSVFRVPIDFFLNNPPSRIDTLDYENFQVFAPSWLYGDYEIWGMSAVILKDFFKVVFNKSFYDDH